MRKIRDLLLLAGLDCFGLVVAYLLTLAAQVSAVSLGIIDYHRLVLGINPLHLLLIFVFFIGVNGLYTRKRPFWDEVREMTKAVTMAMIVILLIFYFAKAPWHFSLSRYWGKLALFYLGIWREKLLILGAGHSGQAVASAILSDPYLGYEIVGFLDDNEELTGKKITVGKQYLKVYGKVKHFRKFISHLQLSTVIISIPSLSANAMARLTTKVQKYCRNLIVIPDLKGVALLNTELHHLFDQQLFLLRINNNLLSRFNRLLKRIFDLAISFALLPLLLPMIALIAIAIRVETGNAAFFVQKRLGRNKTLFDCIKFQTMFPNADAMLDEYFKKFPDRLEEWVQFKKIRGDDPRVTRIGKFLRATSLDELPQIFNVLMGHMSLVSPRPYLPREEADMKDAIDIILLTAPGITGLWQVRGRSELDFETRLQLDTWYVLNWSMWADIEILFKTIRVVFFRKGAF
jgi:undecaprenyl-phosphate galactose phosphotransferase